ncbi:hypothetical protein BLX88_10080 [Bacillus obstructivus]|nr:hypothetical protein [Bacillus sp. Gen3]OJH19511.1 hypothetical protein BLX88_10080 [Bacillus obstructivus]
MKKFLKLLNFELNRFKKIYIVLILLTVVIQITGVIYKTLNYMNDVNDTMRETSINASEYVSQNGTMDFKTILNTSWFFFSVALCAAALVIYLFFIWYREWFGKNTFIYRLLMLPTSRVNIYLSKALTIFLLVLGLIGIQLILLPIENFIFKAIIPTEFRIDLKLADAIRLSDYLHILIPGSFLTFLIFYGLGFLAVTILFTGILFERSFRFKGIIMGGIYCILSVIVFFAPLLIETFFMPNFLYPIERLFIELIMGIVVLIGSISMSVYLLKNKVTV